MKLKRWLLLLAVLNSVMNPCIYSYKDEEMWATFKNLMRCIGNGTRRQRSINANSKPLSSGQDTGNSQPPSEEMKNDEGILKNWKLFLIFLFFFENICPDLNDVYENRLELEREAAYVSSWLGCVCPQIKSSLLKRHFTPTRVASMEISDLLFPLMNANELFCQGVIMFGHIPPILP